MLPQVREPNLRGDWQCIHGHTVNLSGSQNLNPNISEFNDHIFLLEGLAKVVITL